MQRLLLSSIAVTIVSATFSVQGYAQVIYNNPAEHLTDTIRNGEATGELKGNVAELYKKMFNSDSPLIAYGKVIRSLDREGCKRIAVRLTKKNVQMQGTVTDMVTSTEMNYCLDGSIPPADKPAAETSGS